MRLVRQMGLVELARRRCVSYNSKTPPMKRADVQKYLQQLNGWTLAGSNILKEFEFRDYLEGLKFAYSLGKIAEKENHHPDIHIKWKKVRVTLSTHDIKGLSENDFIMAAKAEEIRRKFA